MILFSFTCLEWIPQLDALPPSQGLKWDWPGYSSPSHPICLSWRKEWHLFSSSLWALVPFATIKETIEWLHNDICHFLQHSWMQPNRARGLACVHLDLPQKVHPPCFSLSVCLPGPEVPKDSLAGKEWGKEGIQCLDLFVVNNKQRDIQTACLWEHLSFIC